VLGAEGVAHLVEQFFTLGLLGGIWCCHRGFGEGIIVKDFLIRRWKWDYCGYYNDFFPNKTPQECFSRILFQLQVFRTENSRVML